MKICAVQLEPVAGDIPRNIAEHTRWIEAAAARGAGLVLFPELSLTGYEPRLAQALASGPQDARLDGFQQLSDAHCVIIGAGLPFVAADGTQIGMLIFQPARPRLAYAKQQLHADELPYFVRGAGQLVLHAQGHALAPAICYESLQFEHAHHAAQAGADVYLASVAKPARGVAKAYEHYPAVARQHGMTVVMANCIGPCDDFVGAGQSGVWNRRGELVAQLDAEHEGVIMIDTITGEVRVF